MVRLSSNHAGAQRGQWSESGGMYAFNSYRYVCIARQRPPSLVAPCNGTRSPSNACTPCRGLCAPDKPLQACGASAAVHVHEVCSEQCHVLLLQMLELPLLLLRLPLLLPLPLCACVCSSFR